MQELFRDFFFLFRTVSPSFLVPAQSLKFSGFWRASGLYISRNALLTNQKDSHELDLLFFDLNASPLREKKTSPVHPRVCEM